MLFQVIMSSHDDVTANCRPTAKEMILAVLNCLSPFSRGRQIGLLQTICGSRSGIRQACKKPKTAHMQVALAAGKNCFIRDSTDYTVRVRAHRL